MIPHDVRGIMLQVLFALLPAAALWTWMFGWGLVVNIFIGTGAALTAEAIMLVLRRRPVRVPLTDGSAVVTAVLLAFALPPLAPWWLAVVGVVFAIVFAKHLYGGIGYNPFNPAMVGYAVLLISFPVEMTQWHPPGVAWDAIGAATPLDTVRSAWADPVFSTSGWHWLAPAFLLGGLWLLWQRVIQWTIPVAVLGTIALLAMVAWSADAARFASPVFHLVNGATMICAFFIATDPVSAATTPRGRLLYGIGIGVLVWVIRSFGGYPDAVAFAVLLMNMAAPTLDHFCRPRGPDDAR